MALSLATASSLPPISSSNPFAPLDPNPNSNPNSNSTSNPNPNPAGNPFSNTGANNSSNPNPNGNPFAAIPSSFGSTSPTFFGSSGALNPFNTTSSSSPFVGSSSGAAGEGSVSSSKKVKKRARSSLKSLGVEPDLGLSDLSLSLSGPKKTVGADKGKKKGKRGGKRAKDEAMGTGKNGGEKMEGVRRAKKEGEHRSSAVLTQLSIRGASSTSTSKRNKSSQPSSSKGKDDNSKNKEERRTEREKGKWVKVLRKFLEGRWRGGERGVLDLESMATDPVLKQYSITPAGHKGASNLVMGAIWKLSGELFPELSSVSLASNNLSSLSSIHPTLLISHLGSRLTALNLSNNQLGPSLSALNPLSPTHRPNLELRGGGGEDGPGKPLGLEALKELVVAGNSWEGITIEGSSQGGMVEPGGEVGGPKWMEEVRKRFPRVEMIDGVGLPPSPFPLPPLSSSNNSSAGGGNVTGGIGVSRLLQQASKEAATSSSNLKGKGVDRGRAGKSGAVEFPVTIKGAFAETDVVKNLVGEFLATFLPIFDTDRASLQHVYHPAATFSYAVDTTRPPQQYWNTETTNNKTEGLKGSLKWNDWLGGSRNCVRVRDVQKISSPPFISHGPPEIVQQILSLPSTHHDVSSPQAAANFVVNCFSIDQAAVMATPSHGGNLGGFEGLEAGAIWAKVEGQFMDATTNVARSFDRTFLLVPPPPDSMAAQASFPCLILSDQINLRGWISGKEVWTEGGGGVKLAGSSSSQTQPLTDEKERLMQQLASMAIPEGLHPDQHSLILQLCSITTLTYLYAQQCLESNGWNPEQAMMDFENIKLNIPAEGFLFGENPCV